MKWGAWTEMPTPCYSERAFTRGRLVEINVSITLVVKRNTEKLNRRAEN